MESYSKHVPLQSELWEWEQGGTSLQLKARVASISRSSKSIAFLNTSINCFLSNKREDALRMNEDWIFHLIWTLFFYSDKSCFSKSSPLLNNYCIYKLPTRTCSYVAPTPWFFLFNLFWSLESINTIPGYNNISFLEVTV